MVSPSDGDVVLLNPEVFQLVGADYLRGERSRLVGSQVPIFRVLGQAGGSYRAVPLGWDELPPVSSPPAGAEDFALARQWTRAAAPGSPAETVLKEDSFHKRWAALLELSPDDRVRELTQARKHLEAALKTETDSQRRVELAAGVTETVFLVNRAVIGLQRPGLTANDQILVEETVAVIHSVVALIEEAPLAVSLFRNLQTHTDSQTLDHIVRVFALMAGFLLHYNGLHRSGIIAKIRAAFPTRYREVYGRLLPHLAENWLRSDNVVRLPHLTPGQIRVHALGALMHDIGKIQDLDYFETDSVYDKVKIQRHPVLGSGLFLRTYGNSYEDARYIVGDHHNYLFHPDGYGLTRWDRERRGVPEGPPLCCIADTLETYTSGQALGFLPVEVCAVIDIYDAITDPSRRYKQPLAPLDALQFMEGQFVAKGKVDPVLFDLFIDYLRTLGVDLPPDKGLSAKPYR